MSGSPKNAMKSPKIKRENVSILSPGVKKLKSSKLSQKIKLKSRDKNEKNTKNEATTDLKIYKNCQEKSNTVRNMVENLDNNITNISVKAVDRLGEKPNDERLRDAF